MHNPRLSPGLISISVTRNDYGLVILLFSITSNNDTLLFTFIRSGVK